MGFDLSQKIVSFRRSSGLNQVDLAERLGTTQSTVSRWEKGARPEHEMVKALARVMGVSTDELLASDEVSNLARPLGPTLYVKGAVAAGRWVDAWEWPADDWMTFTGRPDVTAREEHRFGLQIVGDSMNEVYPEGTIVECISLFGQAEAQAGKRAVIIRQRKSDLNYEATVKELVEIDGVLWARPRSLNPAHQAFRLDTPSEDILSVRIVAIVVSSIRPE